MYTHVCMYGIRGCAGMQLIAWGNFSAITFCILLNRCVLVSRASWRRWNRAKMYSLHSTYVHDTYIHRCNIRTGITRGRVRIIDECLRLLIFSQSFFSSYFFSLRVLCKSVFVELASAMFFSISYKCVFTLYIYNKTILALYSVHRLKRCFLLLA